MAKCIFCNIIKKEAPATIIDEDKNTITILDIRPLFPGHCLVIPKQHIVTLPELENNLVKPLFEKAQQLSDVIPKALNAEGTFVAINNIVSQSVPHLHVHVVPRKKGDGLKGFFWPRNGYKDVVQKEAVADAIRALL
jgi:histidine triad (HIT) family protein